MKRFLILLALLLPFTVMAIMLRTMVVHPEFEADLTRVPMNVDSFQGKDIPIGDATAAVLQASKTLLRAYYGPDGELITLYIAYFRDQKYGSQVHSPRHCLPGGGWVVTNLERVPFDLGYETITCNRMTISKRSQVEQMYYWYQTRTGVLASEYSLKFDLVRNSLLLSPTDAALIRLTVSQGNKSVEQCQRIAEDFFQHCIGDIETALPFADRENGT